MPLMPPSPCSVCSIKTGWRDDSGGEAFPFLPMSAAAGTLGLMPLLPLQLELPPHSMAVFGLLDTASEAPPSSICRRIMRDERRIGHETF